MIRQGRKRLPEPRSRNIRTDLEPDGLHVQRIKPHTRDKLYVLGYYLEMFTQSMSKHFDNLVYVDLFAGCGRNEFPSGELIEGSPLIAGRTEPPFTKLIVVEKNRRDLSALEERLRRDIPTREVTPIPGDCNEVIGDVIKAIPPPPAKGAKRGGVLTFCFADPRDLSVRLSTLRRFAPRKVDFIVLIADRMAGARDSTLVKPGNPVVADFLNDPDWRSKWDAARKRGVTFQDFLTERFIAAMTSFGLLAGIPHRVKVAGMEVPLYWLTYFTGHPLGIDFWERARKKAPKQESLPF